MNALQDFKQKKLRLAESLQTLHGLVQNQLQSMDLAKLDAFEQEILADLTFNILCVGDFSSGKTTFVNKFLIESDILPTRATPTTTRLTEVRYGKVLQAMVLNQDGEVQSITENVKETLADYVAANGEHVNTTERVRIEVPSEALADGVVVIDAPGLNDPDVGRMKVTMDYLHQADAVLYFFNAQQAWTKSQKEFLQDNVLGKKELDKLFLMLNYWDCVDDDQRDDLLEYVQLEMHKSLGSLHVNNLERTPDLIPISAKTGENSALVHDKLWNYLSDHKARDIIASKIHRFNIYIDGYLAMVDERLLLSKQNSQKMQQNILILQRELAQYSNEKDTFINQLKHNLGKEWGFFLTQCSEPFNDFIQDIRRRVEALEFTANTDAKFIQKKLAMILSQGQHKVSKSCERLQRNFNQRTIAIIEEMKGEINAPLSIHIAPETYFAKWQQEKNKTTVIMNTAKIASGALATSGVLASLGGIATSAITPTAAVAVKSASGIIGTFSNFLVGASGAATAASTTTTAAYLTAASGGIVCIVGIAGFLVLKQMQANKKEQMLFEFLDNLTSQLDIDKLSYLKALDQAWNGQLDMICQHVDHDILLAFEQKKTELKAISHNDRAEEESIALKQHLLALKMKVN